MSISIIAKNQTSNDLLLTQLSIPDRIIPADGHVELTQWNAISEIKENPELTNYIENDQILLTLNGHDLCKISSLNLAKSFLSSAPINIPIAGGLRVMGGGFSYSVQARFVFGGADKLGIPSAINALTNASVGVTTWVKIYDATNDQIVAEGSADHTAYGIFDLGTLSNIPEEKAIFEVQIKRVGGGQWDSTKVHAVSILF